MFPGRAAGDMHVLHPAIVRDLGDGDLDHGAAALDRFIAMAHQEGGPLAQN
jgi:hypothetical protein